MTSDEQGVECKGREHHSRRFGGRDGRRQSLRLGHRDGRALGVIEAVHGVELHDHVQAVGEHQDHEKTGHQTHPDTRREETCTVTGVRELAATHVEALDLLGGGGSQTG